MRPFISGSGDEFRIYLANERYSQTIKLESLTLSPEPILTARDITAYYWGKHRITYGEDAYQKLLAWGNLYNKLFVVTVGGERIYWGVFTSLISSMGYHNPAILLDPGQGGQIIPREITIDPCYPPGWTAEDDPRSDLRIYASLKNGGVLRP